MVWWSWIIFFFFGAYTLFHFVSTSTFSLKAAHSFTHVAPGDSLNPSGTNVLLYISPSCLNLIFILFFMRLMELRESLRGPKHKKSNTSTRRKTENVPKMATCPGITYLWLLAAAPDPPASGRRSSAGPGCTESGAREAFPGVWTGGCSSGLSLLRPDSHCPSNTWPHYSASPPHALAPSARGALNVKKKSIRVHQMHTDVFNHHHTDVEF